MIASSAFPRSSTRYSPPAPVIIVGGGIGGLVCGEELARKRVPFQLYEASGQFGGRMQSSMHSAEYLSPHAVEMGAEFIDSTHTHMQGLAQRLGLEMDDVRKQRLYECYATKNGHYQREECYDPESKSGGLAGLIELTHRDLCKLQDKHGAWTHTAEAIDRLSMHQYLAQCQQALGRKHAPAELIRLLEAGYAAQFGLEADRISALCFLTTFDPQPDQPFRIFGQSDEAFHIREGNAALIEQLVASIHHSPYARLHHGQELTRIEKQDHGYALYFNHRDIPVMAEKLVLALPLSVLRTIEGWESLPLHDDAKWAVRQAQYGNNTKISLAIPLPEQLDNMQLNRMRAMEFGVFYTDVPSLQNAWVHLPQTPGEPAIFTFLLGGDVTHEPNIVGRCVAALEDTLSLPHGSLDAPSELLALNEWQYHPYAKGSYPCPTPGYLTLYQRALHAPHGTSQEPQSLWLVGDAMDPVFYGHMEGAARSGHQAAQLLIEQRKQRATASSVFR